MMTAMRTEPRATMRTAYIDGGPAPWVQRGRPLSHRRRREHEDLHYSRLRNRCTQSRLPERGGDHPSVLDSSGAISHSRDSIVMSRNDDGRRAAEGPDQLDDRG
jgi:hypothetical protein